MQFVKKEQNSSGTIEYYFFKEISDVDRKMLKQMGFKFKDEQIVDDINCEVWAREPIGE